MQKMKKIGQAMMFCYLFCLSFFCITSNVEADTLQKIGYIIENQLAFTKEPNKETIRTSDYVAPNVLHHLDQGDEVTILGGPIVSTVTTCKTDYYYVSHNYVRNGITYQGYICGDGIQFDVDTSKYEEQFRAAGFPESYFLKLTLLQDAHPNWKFTAFQTGLDWTTSVNQESVVGISYIQSNNPIYLSLDPGSYDPSTKQYIMKEAGGWYAANKETVAYYMDPRNFLDDINIFMFENLGYNPSYQTSEVLNSMLAGTDLLPYAEDFMESATYNGNNVSPISLAARSRQEVVRSDGTLSDSANGKSGYYNFYNLGAFSSCDNPVLCAIDFASGYNGTYTSYNRPWVDPKVAIKSGAEYIANGYINQKQNTLYFQRWNVTSNQYGNYSHQYMTNVSAPLSEASTTRKHYEKIPGLLDQMIEFVIPVYETMPEKPCNRPTEVNQDDLNDANQNATPTDIANMIGLAGYQYNDGYLSKIKIGATVFDLQSKLLANGGADIKIKVFGADGTTALENDSVLSTNQVIQISNLEQTITYRVIIYGDVNGDGKVNAMDYVAVRKHIMGDAQLDGASRLAADVDQSGDIKAVDYVQIKNYIMGNASIIQ